MIEQGTVVKVKKNVAYVEILKKPQCDGCRNCAFGGSNSIVLPSLMMQTPCAAGDRVVLQMPEASFAGASLLLFLLPLLLMLVGLLAGITLGTLFMLTFGFCMLGAGICISVFADRLFRQNPKFSPVVLEKILNEIQ